MASTIKDIARVTGLGSATISAYLNGVTVRPKNKEVIEKAIEELGYVRNEYARGLKTRKSMTIGVLIPDLKNIFSTTIISSMEDELREKGYGVIVADCKNDEEIEKKSIDFLMSKMVDGLIVMPITTNSQQLDAIVQKKLPLVIIDRLTDAQDIPHVLIDNKEVAQNSVKRLIDSNHTSIAMIAGGEKVYTAFERMQGYKQAFADSNLAVDKTNIYNGLLTIEGGYKAMKSIIEKENPPTAVFVANYEMTLGAIIAINECDKKIPKDYSFIGFDNMELAQIVTPKLATINQPLELIGMNSAKVLLELMAGKEVKDNLILKAEFVEGDSIAVCKKDCNSD